MAWVGASVAGALVITAIAVGAPRTWDAGVGLEQRTLQDAFPVPKSALREYLEHTGGSSKLARLNPSMASRIEGGGSAAKRSAGSKGGIESRLQALHLHQMVRFLCYPSRTLVDRPRSLRARAGSGEGAERSQ